jgi:hypothetical protein
MLCVLLLLLLLIITFSIERSSNYAVPLVIKNEQCDKMQNVTMNKEILYGSMLNDCFVGGIGNDIFYGNDEMIYFMEFLVIMNL